MPPRSGTSADRGRLRSDRATLTPIPAAAHQRALALHAEGAEVKAVRVLREDTFLALLHGPAALAVLVRDGSLPTTPAEAAARLAHEDAQLHDARKGAAPAEPLPPYETGTQPP
ncbi:hypothetical protein [Kitasatospora sp. NPDC059827]|uniref:hypothetical protein n=1 Tax=Kitasatospora sp. NPDC059827 TaxID=3346964 RepID=UPI00364F15B6